MVRRAVRPFERHSRKARLARPFHRAARPAVEPYLLQNLEGELEENSVVKEFFTTAADGKEYNVRHYALPMIRID